MQLANTQEIKIWATALDHQITGTPFGSINQKLEKKLVKKISFKRNYLIILKIPWKQKI